MLQSTSYLFISAQSSLICYKGGERYVQVQPLTKPHSFKPLNIKVGEIS